MSPKGHVEMYGLQETVFAEGIVTIVSDNYVILHRYAKNFTSLNDLAGYREVCLTWRRISTRVVVAKNDCRCPGQDGWPKDNAWIHHGPRS